MKKFLIASLLGLVLACQPVSKPGKQSSLGPAQIERPKLVVGIVVDQMRAEYLYRFYRHYGEGGFKRLMQEGYHYKNAHFNYIPTYTGPGHASIYTGTTPSHHGIISNDWYSKAEKRMVYCAEDTSAMPIGTESGAGKMSPQRLQSSTITDELELFTQKQAKVIGMSIKDRGAIMPAGHAADGAYWYESKTGNFISSDWYMDELPDWVQTFNERKLADVYLSQTWNPLLPIEEYQESGPDNVPWESVLSGKESATFPYDLASLRKENGDTRLLPGTPYGNSILAELAKAAIVGEQLGQDEVTDFLAVSFSSTDYVGHAYGPNSKEIEDTYIRLDRDLADFMTYLDSQVGAGNYLLFLTADHAVAEVPGRLQQERIPGGLFDGSAMRDALDAHLNDVFGRGKWVENTSANQVFFNRDFISTQPESLGEIKEEAVSFLSSWPYIRQVVDAQDPALHTATQGMLATLRRGWHPQRSGDLLVDLEPGWFPAYRPTGTTHGSGFAYDTHVPLLWYGWQVAPGSSSSPCTITDIAPTLSMMLHMPLPNSSTGIPLKELSE